MAAFERTQVSTQTLYCPQGSGQSLNLNIARFGKVVSMSLFRRTWWVRLSLALSLTTFFGIQAGAQEDQSADFPPLDQVTKDYEEIKVQTEEGSKEDRSFYRLWINKKTNQVLAELPRDFAADTHRQFIATTLSGGDVFAGLQSSDYYVYWKQYGKRLALVAEDLSIRGSDDESKSSVKRLFTDSVIVDVPIVGWYPRGGPIIDLDELLVNNAGTFFGNFRPGKAYLSKVARVRAFPKNVEIAFEVAGADGNLKVLHYSVSKIEGTAGFKPRPADERIGYFTTAYSDYGKYSSDDTRIRFVNRWHLEKRDPSLKMSPPKQPIVFYIEHTTPVRYRRWVREGVLYWNKAFEQVGIVNAIEVRQQDKQSNEHMNRDPEDVRYNFIRWLNNNVSTAIGPSRVNPLTGEILDADIVLTDGWIRTFEDQFEKVMPRIAMEGMTPETLAWFAEHPEWDPRLRLVSPAQRESIRRQLLLEAQQPYAGHPQIGVKTKALGDELSDGLYNRVSQVNGGCFAADGYAFDVATMRMSMSLMLEDQKPNPESDEQILDGMPESFIGPLLADLVCHEVGHTLGLRHNFKASSIYTLAEINSDAVKGKKPLAGSVMDYLPVNFNFNDGVVQGDFTMIGVGPYDLWAIEYGYTMDDKKLPEILKRVAEPELIYGTDEDTMGPDPLARRYDFSKNPLDFSRSQVNLAKHHREKILEKFVKEGDSWSKARRGYQLTLSLQTRSIGNMANWLGGSFINRDKKGDPNGRKPIEVVPAATQRDALNFVIDNSFFDDAFGLTPDLLVHLVGDSWRDDRGSSMSEMAWPVHDQVAAIQASTLSQIINPTVLRRIYDNEVRTPADQDALTLAEVMNIVTGAVWKELGNLNAGNYTDRKPAISSLRRNLQAEYVGRLFDLSRDIRGSNAALKPIANIATMTLVDLKAKLAAARDTAGLDTYTKAHLSDLHDRIAHFLDAKYAATGAATTTNLLLNLPAREGNDD